MKRSELKEFGPWSEQYSSSGKKYYYNRDSEVSQWEKPPEWRQAEKEHERSKQHKNAASASNEKTERVKAKPCSTHEEHYHYHRSNSNFCSEKEKEKSYSTSKAERRRVSSSVTPDANLIEKGKSPIFHPPAKRSCIGESPTTASKISRSEARRRSIDKSEERKLQSSHSNNSVKLEPHTSDKNVSPSATMPEKFIKSEECREPAPFLFQEEKYAQFYSTELSVYKKNLASEHYLNEAKKHAEKSAKLRATMSSIEIDINSIRSLIRIEELRATNLKKRLKFIREEISSLEEQNR